eukprot:SAG11_NODE_39642_length_226_cov_13.251969_1_plen_32_part_10
MRDPHRNQSLYYLVGSYQIIIILLCIVMLLLC